MFKQLVALILLCKLSHTTHMPQQISMTVLEPGDDFTVMCPVTGHVVGLFYWFKLKFGFMVQTVAAGSFRNLKLKEQFDNSRFTVTYTDTRYFLNITNVSKEDEATYFCQAGTAYEMKVLNGTLLAVNGHKNHQKSVYVEQRPETQSVQKGDSVSLQCSLHYKENRVQCPGEHSVYWFRAGSRESHPGVIYTHNNNSVTQEERSCVYSLSKTFQSSSDYGTYYCAVVTCGEILFGEGTTVETKISGQEVNPVVIVLGTLLALCVIVIAILMLCVEKPSQHSSSDAGTYYCAVVTCGEILFGEGTTVEIKSELFPVVIALGVLLACCVTVIAILIFHVNRSRACEHCKAGAKSASQNPGCDKSTAEQSTDLDGDTEAENYAALNFSARKARSVKKNRESPQECVYSAVRAEYHTQHHTSL
uniref:uncharacterized protein n=1 Tax=Semicossyphus pulcher TaxID=241346 RepID=UPI0037E93775